MIEIFASLPGEGRNLQEPGASVKRSLGESFRFPAFVFSMDKDSVSRFLTIKKRESIERYLRFDGLRSALYIAYSLTCNRSA
jgi:hypothetical protein